LSASLGENRGRTMKIRDVIGLVEAAGWRQVRQRGSHRQFKHPAKSGVVTIAGHPNDEVHPKTLGSILKQAGQK
jgi:predicted RNA binding protein YcfA (HicA-like mRNA interferase family)